MRTPALPSGRSVRGEYSTRRVPSRSRQAPPPGAPGVACRLGGVLTALVAASCAPGPTGGGADAGIVDDADRAWAARAPLPTARQEIGVVAVDGLVYVIGGIDDAGDFLDEVVAYDPVADAWSPRAPLPAAAHHVNAAVVDTADGARIVVAGFLVGGDFAVDGRVFVYAPDDDAWTDGAAMPDARGAAATSAIDGAVYVLGGYAGGAVATASRYVVDDDAWEALPDVPAPRDHAVGGAIDGVAYVVGGRSGGIFGHSTDVYALDPSTSTWTTRAPLPTSRGGAAGAVVDGRLLVVGGEGDTEAQTGVFDEVEEYDPDADAWTTRPSMRTPRHGMGAAVVDGALVVPGGATRAGFAAVDVVEAYAP